MYFTHGSYVAVPHGDEEEEVVEGGMGEEEEEEEDPRDEGGGDDQEEGLDLDLKREWEQMEGLLEVTQEGYEPYLRGWLRLFP